MRRAAAVVAALVVLSTGAVACSDDDAPTVDPPGVDPDVRPTTTETADATTTTAAEVENTESIAEVSVALEEIVQLDDAPLAMAVRPGHDDQLFVALRSGTLVRLTLDEDGAVTSQDTVLDFADDVSTDGERGFLGVAFSPEGDRLYASYTNPDGDTRIDEYEVGDEIDVASRREVFAQDQPFSNHNGGNVVFGPDGYLYFGLGDGGGAGDPLDAAQDLTQNLGKILRFDPTADETPYGVPEDNPYADGADGARREIWIYGVRNPWRFSFDAATGDLWVADVGQNAIEEVDFLPADDQGRNAGRDANLGWSEMEGDQPYEDGQEPAGHTPPLLTYSHDDGCSITGGYAYRGEAIDDLQGAYLYGDLCAGEVRAVLAADGQVVEDRSLGVGVDASTLVSFGEGPDGELYVLSAAGTVSRIVPA